MTDRKYVALRWIARHLPWTWRHLVPAATRAAWVDASVDRQSLTEADAIQGDIYTARLERILAAPSTEEPRE